MSRRWWRKRKREWTSDYCYEIEKSLPRTTVKDLPVGEEPYHREAGSCNNCAGSRTYVSLRKKTSLTDGQNTVPISKTIRSSRTNLSSCSIRESSSNPRKDLEVLVIARKLWCLDLKFNQQNLCRPGWLHYWCIDISLQQDTIKQSYGPHCGPCACLLYLAADWCGNTMDKVAGNDNF